MNPKTGDILAMATYPNYDLNTPFTPNETLAKTYDSLSSSEKIDIKCGQINLFLNYMNLVLYLKL